VCNKTEGRKENKKSARRGGEDRGVNNQEARRKKAPKWFEPTPFGSPYRSALHKSGFFINQFLMNSIINIQKA
jgi:hypothetical protein